MAHYSYKKTARAYNPRVDVLRGLEVPTFGFELISGLERRTYKIYAGKEVIGTVYSDGPRAIATSLDGKLQVMARDSQGGAALTLWLALGRCTHS